MPAKPLPQNAVKPGRPLRVLGVDPGFESMGTAVVELGPTRKLKILDLRMIKTAKSKTAKLIRADDERRYREIWSGLDAIAKEFPFDGIAMENFVPFRSTSGAWKVSRVCGLIHGWALATNVSFDSYSPQDLKRQVAGNVSATKEDVEAALRGQVGYFGERIDKFPKGVHEHLADATGHATLHIKGLLSLYDAVFTP